MFCLKNAIHFCVTNWSNAFKVDQQFSLFHPKWAGTSAHSRIKVHSIQIKLHDCQLAAPTWHTLLRLLLAVWHKLCSGWMMFPLRSVCAVCCSSLWKDACSCLVLISAVTAINLQWKPAETVIYAPNWPAMHHGAHFATLDCVFISSTTRPYTFILFWLEAETEIAIYTQ